MVLSSSFVTCYKMLMLRKILDYVLFGNMLLLLRNSLVDLFFVERSLAKVIGMGTFAFSWKGAGKGTLQSACTTYLLEC